VGLIPDLGRSPKEGMATHSSILVWKIPWTDEPGGLSPWGCQESNTTEATEHSSMHFSTKLCACYILGKRRQYLINIYLTKYSSNQHGHSVIEHRVERMTNLVSGSKEDFSEIVTFVLGLEG